MERDVASFESPEAWEAWLAEHHARTTGVWLKIAKKGKGPSVTYAQALDAALCWGWIDGQKDKFDEASWLQYFTRRKPRSVWSQVNRQHIERLTTAGRMRPPGLAAVEAARANGEWDAAYQPTSSREVPEELQRALDASPRAQAFFDTLNSQNRFSFVYRTLSAKRPETRARRVAEFVRMLEDGEVFHPGH